VSDAAIPVDDDAARVPTRVTSRDYAHPYRPLPIAAANAMGRGLRDLGLRRELRAEAIVAAATRAAGSGPMSDDFREGLGVLVESIEREADLTPVGRMITRRRLVGALAARFRAEARMAANPAALDAPLAQPIIITGLQRTGSTLLHRLIAADGRVRSLSSAEVLNPVPPVLRPGKEDPRVRAARAAERGARWLAPDFFAVHPIDHRAPEEEVLVLDLTLRSTVAEAILRVPTYSAWLEGTDSTPAYAFLRRLMLMLQADELRPMWVLKTPHHLEYLDVLLAVFPEAKVVQTHRDPAQTVASFLSMVAHGYGMFSDRVRTREIAAHWLAKCLRMTERGMAVRAALDPAAERATFLDVQYRELIADPIGTVDRIYAFAGADFPATARADATAFLAADDHEAHGRHAYDLADFGLTREGVREAFADYIEEYGL